MVKRYSNVKKHVHPDGTKLDSGRELKRYCDLLLLQKAGEIRDLQVHPRYPITIAGIEIRYCGSNRHLTYVGDFRYYDEEKKKWILEDTKMQSSHRTEVYKIKKALVQAMGLEILET